MSLSERELDRATKLARLHLDRIKTGTKRLLVGSLLVSFACFFVLAVETASAVRLQDHGRHGWARIERVSDGSVASISVTYPASHVSVVIPLWFGTRNYVVGGRVLISYDEADPSHSVIATGFPAPSGWHAWPSPVLVASLILAVYALMARRWDRRSRSLLRKPPKSMSIVATAIAGTEDLELILLDTEQPIATMGRVSIQDWTKGPSSRAVLVFGDPVPNATVVAVDLEQETALLRRLSARPSPYAPEASA
jgi:hypothetical protein